jgi:hypothetical protein
MRGAELQTGSTRTLAASIQICMRRADLRAGNTRALLRLAYRFDREKLLIPATQLDPLYKVKTDH